jgi:Predicted hydrolase of the metallo-beta-lactamase superfamily
VLKKLSEVFANAAGRIIVTTFASNMHRIRQVLEVAYQYDRQVAILGRSMLNIAALGRELGYMKYPDGLLVTADEVNHLD